MNAWLRWKRRWRQLERARWVLLVKRRVRQLVGTELPHYVQTRRATEQFGDWTVSTADLERGGVAYCFGVGEDAELEFALADRFGMDVHAFDPTPRALAWIATQPQPDSFAFHETGVAGFDGTAVFTASADPTNPSFRITRRSEAAADSASGAVSRISTITGRLGHDRIALLKLDIEGAEYDVIDDLLASGIRVRQLLIEFHHRFRSVGREPTARAVRQLQAAGYLIFSISPDGREYSFIHAGLSNAEGL